MKSRRPTQADVAKLAGVSQAAVSQVLNRNDSTRQEEKKQRLLDAIDQLGYIPNTQAQGFEPLLHTYLTKFHEWLNIMRNLFKISV